VAAGSDHTVALTADGRLFSFGRGQAGQLGSGNRKDRPLPEEMNAPAATVWAVHAEEVS
jgi:E3 ubiquitin-protein ligase HERC4